MYLVLPEFETPDVPIPWDYYEYGVIAAVAICQEVSHKSRVASLSRLRQLDLCEQPVLLRTQILVDAHNSRYNQAAILLPGILQGSGKRRELRKSLRAGYVLIAQGVESVVGRYEEILAGYVCQVIKWRLVRFNLHRIMIPHLLDAVGNCPPGGQCPAMHVQG